MVERVGENFIILVSTFLIISISVKLALSPFLRSLRPLPLACPAPHNAVRF